MSRKSGSALKRTFFAGSAGSVNRKRLRKCLEAAFRLGSRALDDERKPLQFGCRLERAPLAAGTLVAAAILMAAGTNVIAGSGASAPQGEQMKSPPPPGASNVSDHAVQGEPKKRYPTSFAEVVQLLKETAQGWSNDNASRIAAALACYTLLSMAPLVVLCVAMAGMVFGREAAQGQLGTEVGRVVGAEGAQVIQAVVANAKNPDSGVIASIIGIAVLLFGASGVFGELQSALNTVWEVEAKPGRGVVGIIKDRFFSFSMVLGMGFLLLLSLVVSAALAAIGNFLTNALPLAWVWQIVNQLISLAVTTVIFALIFKVVPDVTVAWRDVWMGAFFTALLFSIGRLGLAQYLAHASVGSAYGAAGSIVVLVLWIYYSAQIFLFGAEFTEAYASRYGARIEPSKNAVAIGSRAKEAPHKPAT